MNKKYISAAAASKSEYFIANHNNKQISPVFGLPRHFYALPPRLDAAAGCLQNQRFRWKNQQIWLNLRFLFNILIKNICVTVHFNIF